jgi:hypothetical protein
MFKNINKYSDFEIKFIIEILYNLDTKINIKEKINKKQTINKKNIFTFKNSIKEFIISMLSSNKIKEIGMIKTINKILIGSSLFNDNKNNAQKSVILKVSEGDWKIFFIDKNNHYNKDSSSIIIISKNQTVDNLDKLKWYVNFVSSDKSVGIFSNDIFDNDDTNKYDKLFVGKKFKDPYFIFDTCCIIPIHNYNIDQTDIKIPFIVGYIKKNIISVIIFPQFP